MHRSKIGALSASLALTLVTLGCGRPDAYDMAAGGTTATGNTTTAVASGDIGTPTRATLRVADITGNPDKYIGQTVTVEADVEEVLSAFAFKLDEDAPLAGGVDNDLMVLSPKSLNLAAIDDQWLNNKVRVAGTVRRMSIVEIEREIGWDLDPKIEAELEGTRPVLIARSVERIRGG